MKVIVALIFLINLSKCFCLTSLQATEESCVVNKLGERSCSFEKIIVLTFNPEEQQIQVSLNDHTGKILGTLTMEIHKTKAFCNKSLKYFSRFFHIQIESSKRCAETGSCYDLKCSELKSYEKLIEFNATNDYPGITQCVESSGGWFSGCFYTTPACTFYRFYATPVDERILEIFECPKWELGLSMNLTIDTNEGKWESAFNLVPGMASRQSKNKIEITLKSITTPILPVLNKNFVFDGKKAAMLDYEIETQLNKFKCANKYQAGNFNCTVDPLTCSCRPADDNVNCLCTEIIKDEQIFQESNNLPFDHNGILVKVDHGEITAFPDLTSAEVQIKIEGMILKTEISMNTCIVRANLTGCFDCKKGAHVDLECKTDFGSTLANIICPSAKMAIPCRPTIERKILSIHFSTSDIDETCEVFCGSSPTTFQLQGKLAYPEAALNDVIWNEEYGNKTAPHWQLKLPNMDITNLLKLLIFPRYLFLLIISIFLFFLMFYCILPLLTRLLLSCILNTFAARSVGNNVKLQSKYV
nr:unnamed protein product [Meloidogyne enterolobii]CAD2181131.1 unnamed protein product [Meloidogyne enterolobii]